MFFLLIFFTRSVLHRNVPDTTQKALIELTLKLLGTGCSDMLTDEVGSPAGAGTTQI